MSAHEDSLLDRVNVALERVSGETLIRSKTARELAEFGAYRLVAWDGRIAQRDVSITDLALELGVVRGRIAA